MLAKNNAPGDRALAQLALAVCSPRRSLSAHCVRPRRSVERGWPYNLPLPTVRAELTADLRTNCTNKRLELPADLARAG